MLEYLPQALTSLSTALTIGKSLVETSDTTKRQDLLMQFNSAIIDAQSKIMSFQEEKSVLKDKIEELENECKHLKSWDAEREKYTSREIAFGVFAYIEKNYEGHLGNAHKYCYNCFDNYKKSTLQHAADHKQNRGNISTLTCPNGCPRLEFSHYKE